MSVRQEWLEELLTIERDLRANGHDIELITRPELHAIRIEWLHDPAAPGLHTSTIVKKLISTNSVSRVRLDLQIT